MRMQSKEDEAAKEPHETTKAQDGADSKEKEGAEARQSAGEKYVMAPGCMCPYACVCVCVPAVRVRVRVRVRAGMRACL